MLKNVTASIVIICAALCSMTAQNPWNFVEENQVIITDIRRLIPDTYQVVNLNLPQFHLLTQNALHQDGNNLFESTSIISIPFPDGTEEEFRFVETEIMKEPLATNFSHIRTFDGCGVKDRLSRITFDYTERGFHAMGYVPGKGHFFIDPYVWGNLESYVVYWKKDYTDADPFECQVRHTKDVASPEMAAGLEKAGNCNFQEYDLAVATTGEYSNYHGATSSAQEGLVLSAIVTTMNRVNGVYKVDFGVVMVLVGNTNSVFFYNPSSDPYSNANGSAMLAQNQTELDNTIGSASYDIGHVFSTGGGGVAYLQSPCNNSQKAGGVTGQSNPVGDPFDIDYVAHEMGHQFGGNHTQNNSCNRALGIEPGSGHSIMGYAGICSPNVQNNSDAFFNTANIIEARTFISTGNGATCATTINSSNSNPTSDAGSTHTIPISTPFVLTGTGTDPDGDPLSYNWEQIDTGVETMPPASTNTTSPMFRGFLATASPSRYFPALSEVANNNSPTWEVLPSVSRDMNFTLTVRDNAASYGCTAESNVLIKSDASAGPFLVTSPNTTTTLAANDCILVEWDVANTDNSIINSQSMDIFLSTDGGLTFPTLLASGVANSGKAYVNIPSMATSTGRIMVKAADNIFFDMSNADFTINTSPAADYGVCVDQIEKSFCASIGGSFDIDVTSVGGYSGSVIFTSSGLPGATTAIASANPASPGSMITVTIGNTSALGVGTYNFNLLTNSSAGNKSIPLTFNIVEQSATPTLSSPANAEQGVSTSPSFAWSADAASDSYNIDIATDAAFTNIVETGTNNTNSYTATNTLSEAATYYWRVRGNSACGAGSYAAEFSFTTRACKTYTSNTVVNISGNGTPTITSDITVPDSGTITEVNIVGVDITHSYASDLVLKIISHTSTEVTLVSNECGSSDDVKLSFDDSATSAITCPLNANNTQRPEGNLSSFNSQELNGTWTLEVDDTAGGDGGSLNTWGIELCADNLVILPVELVELTATATEDHIELFWATFQEINNKGFEVERRAEGEEHFRVIGFVEGKGDSETRQNYYFNDKDVIANETYYYRLKQLDFDNSFDLSNVVSASLVGKELAVQIYPNPTKGDFEVQVNSPFTEDMNIAIYNIQGQLIQEQVIDQSTQTISMNNQAAGIYLIKISAPNGTLVQQLVKN